MLALDSEAHMELESVQLTHLDKEKVHPNCCFVISCIRAILANFETPRDYNSTCISICSSMILILLESGSKNTVGQDEIK